MLERIRRAVHNGAMKKKRRIIHYSVISLLMAATFSLGIILAQLLDIAVDKNYL